MSKDININESAILETLNAKIDYDGGNYKGSGLANYVVDKSGDTMTAPLTIKTSYGGHLQGVRTGVNFGDKPTSQQNIGGFRCYVNNTAESNITALIQGYIRTISAQSSNGIQFITRKPDNSGWGAGMNLETLADGTYLFDFPKCTTKATTTSTAKSNKVAVIVQNYKNGNSWYRVWSDGWIEQGGLTGGIGIGGTITVTLLKAFTDANYTLLGDWYGTSSYSIDDNPSLFGKTTSSFQIYASVHGANDGYNLPVSWYACGY